MVSDYTAPSFEYYRLALEQFDAASSDSSDCELMRHNLAIVISNYAMVLREQGRRDEAEQTKAAPS
jgi:hypothetical protein